MATTLLRGPAEYDHYADTGCEFAPSCLACPLPVCKEDAPPGWLKRHRRRLYDSGVVRVIRQESLTAEQAAARFGVTVRSIYRIKARCRG